MNETGYKKHPVEEKFKKNNIKQDKINKKISLLKNKFFKKKVA